ncbi:MAG: hypothetical protein IKT32_04785 [Clostridia bacterium]|nr:hypothetical protein [Clostridia bacterium]
MASLNWYLKIRNLAKTDPVAAEIFNLLQTAGTDDEKESAKQQAQEYIASKESGNNIAEENTTTNEETVVEEDLGTNNEPVVDDSLVDPVSDDEPVVEERSQEDEEKVKQDLSQLAFNPRLAKCGITREEELFLNHVYVRKLSHDEKIEMRRAIYQKKTVRNAAIQAEYKAKRMAQKIKDLNDPEKIRFHQERKLVAAINDALTNHKNLGWIFSKIEGLTPEIMREFIEKPGIRNGFNRINPDFIPNFHKKYGE